MQQVLIHQNCHKIDTPENVDLVDLKSDVDK